MAQNKTPERDAAPVRVSRGGVWDLLRRGAGRADVFLVFVLVEGRLFLDEAGEAQEECESGE